MNLYISLKVDMESKIYKEAFASLTDYFSLSILLFFIPKAAAVQKKAQRSNIHISTSNTTLIHLNI